MERSYRKRSRAGSANSQPSAPCSGVTESNGDEEQRTNAEILDPVNQDPSTVRLQIVVSMVAEGQTQPAIAAHFGRDERTIRRWITRARALGVGVPSDLVPENVVNQTMRNFLEFKADLLELKREGEATGDSRLRIFCIRELCRIEVAYIVTLERIGVFDGYRYSPPDPIDPAVQSADRIRQAAREALAPASGDGEEA